MSINFTPHMFLYSMAFSGLRKFPFHSGLGAMSRFHKDLQISYNSIFNSKANASIKIGLCRSAVESILLYGLECLPLTLTLQDKLDSAYRRILRYALGVHFPVCISNAELARRTGATALSKTLRQRRFRLVGHALRMANPSPLTILLHFLQLGLRRRRGQARTLTLHQNIIDDISATNQCVKSMTSASSSYFNRIVATLSTN